jgi:hypothetical protein
VIGMRSAQWPEGMLMLRVVAREDSCDSVVSQKRGDDKRYDTITAAYLAFFSNRKAFGVASEVSTSDG